MKTDEKIKRSGTENKNNFESVERIIESMLDEGCELDVDESELFEIQSRFCRIFSEPKRLRIMWCLMNVERSVGEIAEQFSLSMSNVSQHLRIMRDLGAVLARRDGRHVYYTLANKKFVLGSALIREGLKDEMSRRRL